MSHSPFQCIWRRWIRPLFVYGALCATPPEDKKLTDDMIKEIIDHVYRSENFQDFYDDILERPSNRGRTEWYLYLTEEGKPKSTPLPGSLLMAIAVGTPYIASLFVMFCILHTIGSIINNSI